MYDQVVKCQRAGLCLSEHFLIVEIRNCVFDRWRNGRSHVGGTLLLTRKCKHALVVGMEGAKVNVLQARCPFLLPDQ